MAVEVWCLVNLTIPSLSYWLNLITLILIDLLISREYVLSMLLMFSKWECFISCTLVKSHLLLRIFIYLYIFGFSSPVTQTFILYIFASMHFKWWFTYYIQISHQANVGHLMGRQSLRENIYTNWSLKYVSRKSAVISSGGIV